MWKKRMSQCKWEQPGNLYIQSEGNCWTFWHTMRKKGLEGLTLIGQTERKRRITYLTGLCKWMAEQRQSGAVNYRNLLRTTKKKMKSGEPWSTTFWKYLTNKRIGSWNMMVSCLFLKNESVFSNGKEWNNSNTLVSSSAKIDPRQKSMRNCVDNSRVGTFETDLERQKGLPKKEHVFRIILQHPSDSLFKFI